MYRTVVIGNDSLFTSIYADFGLDGTCYLTLVAVWSGVNVAGVRLSDMDPKVGTGENSDKWVKVHHEVINRLDISC